VEVLKEMPPLRLVEGNVSQAANISALTQERKSQTPANAPVDPKKPVSPEDKKKAGKCLIF
jgi:hypothetical protein